MEPNDSETVSGFEFVKKVIEINRFRAGDYLVEAAGGECQWLEFKTVIGISRNDPVVSSEAAAGKPIRQLCERETKRNLRRIATAMVSLYNTRGGCVLIGVCENNSGVAMPTVVANRAYGGFWNRLSHFMKFPFVFFRGCWLVWGSRRYLKRMDALLKLSAADRRISIRQLYEPVVVFFKGIPVWALVVKCIKDGSSGIICESENEAGRHLIYYRKGASTAFVDCPGAVNPVNDYDLVRNEALHNDDLYQKLISHSYAPPNRVIRILGSFIRLFKKSFVASSITYIARPVSPQKLHSRIRVSLFYYGSYFLLLNSISYILGMNLLLSIAVLVGLAIAIYEIRMRIDGSNISIWPFVIPAMAALLILVGPSQTYILVSSSAILAFSILSLSIWLKNSFFSTRKGEVLSQGITLVIYFLVVVIQYPLVLIAFNDKGGFLPKDYFWAFIVDLIPVIPSIIASRNAIVYYDGFFIGCILFFYMPYFLILIGSIFSFGEDVKIFPEKMAPLVERYCKLSIILAVIGAFYMVIISFKAIEEASTKKRWDVELKERNGQPVQKQANDVDRRVKLTMNDYFARAFCSYCYSYSNEVDKVLSQSQGAVCERRLDCLKVATANHCKGLRNISYIFIGCSYDDGDDDVDEDYEIDEEIYDDFISDPRLCVDAKLIALFEQYVAAVNKVANARDSDAYKAFDDMAKDIKDRIVDQFQLMRLSVDRNYIQWINRGRR